MHQANSILGLLAKHQLSCKPANYILLFEAAREQGSDLTKLIASALEGSSPQERLDELHSLFIAPIELSERLCSLADRLLEQAKMAIQLAADAAADLNRPGSQIEPKYPLPVEQDQLQHILSALIEEAEQLKNKAQRIRIQFQSAKLRVDALQNEIGIVAQQSHTDFLTGLANRRTFEKRLSEYCTHRASSQPLTVAFLDIDYFKQVNDEFGHLTGDEIIRFVGTTIRQNIKGKDVAARYGGEEFGIILPNTPMEGAIALPEAIRKSVAQQRFLKRSSGQTITHITISAGLASHRTGEDASALLSRADACLYRAKKLGRNRAVSDHEKSDIDGFWIKHRIP